MYQTQIEDVELPRRSHRIIDLLIALHVHRSAQPALFTGYSILHKFLFADEIFGEISIWWKAECRTAPARGNQVGEVRPLALLGHERVLILRHFRSEFWIRIRRPEFPRARPNLEENG